MDKLGAIVAAVAMYALTQSPYAIPPVRRRGAATGADGKLLPGRLAVHHIIQLVIALALIAGLEHHGWSEWGFNLHDAATSVRVALVISAIYGALSFALHLADPPADLSWKRRDTAGLFAFEWLLPGPSEEVVFRALIQTFLSHTWTGSFRFVGVDFPAAGLIAALIFSAAHAIPKPDAAQLVTAFVLGTVYAVVYANTGSLLGPVLIHNASDGLVVTAMYVGYRRRLARG